MSIHESCLVLLASGMQGKVLHRISGITHFPRFETVMAKTEANTVGGYTTCKLIALQCCFTLTDSAVMLLQRRKLEASKGKQFCLGMARTAILERRPLSMVSRGIEVLVILYAHSLKTGTYLKGTRPEMTSSCSEEHSGGPRKRVSASTGRVDSLGKSTKHESNAGNNNESPIRSSNTSGSESEDNTHFQSLKIKFSLLMVENENLVGTQISTCEVQPSSFQSQPLDVSSNPLKAHDSDQQDPHLTSPAISPDDMYNFVFTPVQEELVGDSYLVAIIVEYLCWDVNTIQPTLFLEATLASNDSQVLAAVLRFFGDFIPGFRNSMDHRTYSRILNETFHHCYFKCQLKGILTTERKIKIILV